jgi:hypothetical protein
MKGNELGTYPPLNTLKRVADEVWIANGPIIRFGPRFMSMPFSTRITIIRCGESEPLRPFADAADRHAQNRDRSRPRIALDHRTQPHSLLVDSGMESGISGGRFISPPRIKEQAKGRGETCRRNNDRVGPRTHHFGPWRWYQRDGRREPIRAFCWVLA